MAWFPNKKEQEGIEVVEDPWKPCKSCKHPRRDHYKNLSRSHAMSELPRKPCHAKADNRLKRCRCIDFKESKDV